MVANFYICSHRIIWQPHGGNSAVSLEAISVASIKIIDKKDIKSIQFALKDESVFYFIMQNNRVTCSAYLTMMRSKLDPETIKSLEEYIAHEPRPVTPPQELSIVPANDDTQSMGFGNLSLDAAQHEDSVRPLTLLANITDEKTKMGLALIPHLMDNDSKYKQKRSERIQEIASLLKGTYKDVDSFDHSAKMMREALIAAMPDEEKAIVHAPRGAVNPDRRRLLRTKVADVVRSIRLAMFPGTPRKTKSLAIKDEDASTPSTETPIPERRRSSRSKKTVDYAAVAANDHELDSEDEDYLNETPEDTEARFERACQAAAARLLREFGRTVEITTMDESDDDDDDGDDKVPVVKKKLDLELLPAPPVQPIKLTLKQPQKVVNSPELDKRLIAL